MLQKQQFIPQQVKPIYQQQHQERQQQQVLKHSYLEHDQEITINPNHVIHLQPRRAINNPNINKKLDPQYIINNPTNFPILGKVNNNEKLADTNYNLSAKPLQSSSHRYVSPHTATTTNNPSVTHTNTYSPSQSQQINMMQARYNNQSTTTVPAVYSSQPPANIQQKYSLPSSKEALKKTINHHMNTANRDIMAIRAYSMLGRNGQFSQQPIQQAQHMPQVSHQEPAQSSSSHIQPPTHTSSVSQYSIKKHVQEQQIHQYHHVSNISTNSVQGIHQSLSSYNINQSLALNNNNNKNEYYAENTDEILSFDNHAPLPPGLGLFLKLKKKKKKKKKFLIKRPNDINRIKKK